MAKSDANDLRTTLQNKDRQTSTALNDPGRTSASRPPVKSRRNSLARRRISAARKGVERFLQSKVSPLETRHTEQDIPFTNDYSAQAYQSTDLNLTDYTEYMGTYESVGWVHMAVSQKGMNVAQIPIQVRNKKTKAPAEGHLLEQLFKNPNPHETGKDFLANMMNYLELTGNCYVEKIRDHFGITRNIYLYPPDRCRPVPDPVTKVKAYDLQSMSGETRRVSPDKIIHIRYPNPNSEYFGVGRIAAARTALCLDTAAENYNLSFFKNNAIPAALLVPEEPLSRTQLNRVRSKLKQEFMGVSNQHGIGILAANMKLEKVGIDPKDIEFLEQQKFTRDKIGSMFHVPPIYMGNFGDASFANADAQRKMFWEVTLIPWMEWMLDQLNAFLVPVVDGAMELYIDYYKTIPLIESFQSLTKSVQNLRNAGFITTNEGRGWLGLDPMTDDENADTILIPAQFVPEELQGQEPEEPEPEEGDPGSDPNDEDQDTDGPESNPDNETDNESSRLFDRISRMSLDGLRPTDIKTRLNGAL